MLASCYQQSLGLALEAAAGASAAFPNISTGVYRFPKTFGAQVAKQAVQDWASHHGDADLLVCFCFCFCFCFSSESDARLFKEAALPSAHGLRVFLDDERPTPEGWVSAYWPEEVIALLDSGA